MTRLVLGGVAIGAEARTRILWVSRLVRSVVAIVPGLVMLALGD